MFYPGFFKYMKFCLYLPVGIGWLIGLLVTTSVIAQTGNNLEISILPGNLKCGGGTDGFFRILPKKGIPPVKYVWNCAACNLTGNATLAQFSQPFDIEKLPAGKYTFTFTDAVGASLIETSELTQPDKIIAVIKAEGDKCLGQNFGKVAIERISGGVPPYLFAFNGGNPGNLMQWNNLASGQYFLDIIDAAGCIKKEGAVLPLGVSFVFNVGNDTTIFSGDTLRIVPTASRKLDSLHWSPQQFTVPSGDGATLLFPKSSTTFQVFAADTNGCGASDRITVQVRNKRRIFAPNIFAPAAVHAENAVFFLSGSGGIETVEYLKVVDRDGRLWFDRRNFPVNAPSEGWQGDYQGDKAPSGIYIWIAEVRYTNGRSDVFTGDVTLVR